MKALFSALLAAILAVFAFFGNLFNPPKPPQPPVESTTSVVATTAPLPASETFAFTLESIQALGLTVYEETITTVNSYPTTYVRTWTGVRVKDVLTAMGANMSRLNSGSTLHVTTTDNFMPDNSFDYAVIMSDLTLLSWYYVQTAPNASSSTATIPRFVPGSTGNHALLISNACALTITY